MTNTKCKKTSMNLQELCKRLRETAIYPKEARIVYPALGLAGEVGEVLEEIRKEIWPSEKHAKGLLEASVYICLGKMIDAAKDCEKLKKVIRDKKGAFEPDMYEKLGLKTTVSFLDDGPPPVKSEIGDVMWYINALLGDLGLSLTNVLKENLEKVESRKKRGKLQGSGSNR